MTTATPTTKCPGCGLVLAQAPGPVHAYLGASAECWALYGTVLAREYGEPAYFGVHQLTADTYAVQHPGEPERRTIQSLALHLITLGMFVEGRAQPADGSKLHKRLVGAGPYEWLEPPSTEGRLTIREVADAHDPVEHEERVMEWARDVWDAWSPHHDFVRGWEREALG
jgi:hypothetical protein